MKRLSIATFTLTSSYFSALFLVLYHLVIGAYTIKSWTFNYLVWSVVLLSISSQHFIWFSFSLIHRIPFELDSTYRCFLFIVFQALVSDCFACVYCTITGTMLVSMIYVDTFLLDIKFIFDNHVGLNFARRDDNFLMRLKCKEAIMLHARVIQYFLFSFLHSLPFSLCNSVINFTAFRLMDHLAEFTNMIILLMISPWAVCSCFGMFTLAKVRIRLTQLAIAFQFFGWFQYSGNNFAADLQIPIITLTAPLITMFVHFYIGQKFHLQLIHLGEMVYQSEWHRYPSYVKRYLLMVIMRSQKSYFLSAFGVMTLCFENYVAVSRSELNTMSSKSNQILHHDFQVLKWIYSTFMLLRSME